MLNEKSKQFFYIPIIKWKVEMDLCIPDSYFYPKSENQIPNPISLTAL